MREEDFLFREAAPADLPAVAEIIRLTKERMRQAGSLQWQDGYPAREDMERFMGTKVYLQTWVKVKENWRDNVNFIRSQGYNEQ